MRLLGKLPLIGLLSISYLSVLSQERFNIRNQIEFESVAFKGVEETANHQVITCNGLQTNGSGNENPYAFVRFNLGRASPLGFYSVLKCRFLLA